MFAYIKGILEIKANNYVVIDVSGIGYKIFMSASNIDKIGETGDKVKVFTHYYVREDIVNLYGFLTDEELRMFELLINVSGIGAKSAITMLSEITPTDFALSVISNDVTKLTKIQGIGAKTAQRIILELKDKLKTEQSISKQDTKIQEKISEETNYEEAISALQILGYNKREIEKTLEKLELQGLSIEDIIRKALNILGK